jgi:transcriptional regulator with XRE-family HTH domain
MKKTITDKKYHRFVDWLRQARIDRGMTIRQLGDLLEVPNSFISKIEMAERRLDVYEYVQYCEALKVDPKDGLKLLS